MWLLISHQLRIFRASIAVQLQRSCRWTRRLLYQFQKYAEKLRRSAKFDNTTVLHTLTYTVYERTGMYKINITRTVYPMDGNDRNLSNLSQLSIYLSIVLSIQKISSKSGEFSNRRDLRKWTKKQEWSSWDQLIGYSREDSKISNTSMPKSVMGQLSTHIMK